MSFSNKGLEGIGKVGLFPHVFASRTKNNSSLALHSMADNPTSAELVLPDVDMLKWISKGPLTVSKVRLGSRGRIRDKRCQIG